MSDIRYNRLQDEHVIVASERLHRPNYHNDDCSETPTPNNCPFCEGNERFTVSEIFAIRQADSQANKKGWQTRVIPNLYKAVQIEEPCEHHFGLFEHWKGFGAHEVIIDVPEHFTSMTQWSVHNVIAWLKTLKSRVADLRGDQRMAYISLFKNEGSQAGATQLHSHTQLIALPFIPKTRREEYERSYAHYQQHGETLLASEIRKEEEAMERVVASSGEFTAYCPYASAYPFEMIISSKNALGQIDTLSEEHMETLAPLLLQTVKSLKSNLGCVDFNLEIFTPPLQEGTVEHNLLHQVNEVCRFGIRIMPRIYKHAGFELNTGIIINPVSPEYAAKLLREKL
ncbi:MAG: UTP--glucose-1-phosphate uridylyltransferase [Epsilonproteobacteria bacterium]|nr:UTP--glucose-1-phosphate uridylyltransferase [Campylobacterota bacterium]